jgi:hypothetical protein
MDAREAAADAQARISGMACRGDMKALKWRKPRRLVI